MRSTLQISVPVCALAPVSVGPVPADAASAVVVPAVQCIVPAADPRDHSAIFHRRLTAQEPLLGHRVVAARLSKVP